jgi:competence protein ComEA
MKRLLFLLLTSLACASAWAAINLNSASQQELQTLKGIGPAKARAIIEYRDKHGPFKAVQDLRNVPGFGDKTVKRLENDLILSGPSVPLSSDK